MAHQMVHQMGHQMVHQTDMKPNPEPLPFFVYGTLLPGQPNAYLWQEAVAGQQTAVLPNGRLYDLGAFPMLVQEGEESVRGVLLQIEAEQYQQVLDRLDALEGYDPTRPDASAYRRVKCLVTGADGRLYTAWVYLGHTAAQPDMKPIPGGDWAAYAAATFPDIEQWWQSIASVHGLLNPPPTGA
ncbi:MAG: gamma-glutamylcyclotransferase [Chloroflexi bacterium]|nr:gamma-glutamylcyclotransferase [Chloroflexota bacterium]